MFKGFYNLTSGMLTQQRNLNVVSANITNLSTAGYKADVYTSSTFDEVMYARVGNRYRDSVTEIGPVSYIRATSEIYVDFTQGTLEPTSLPLDFAIEGDGFFAVRNGDGEVAYSRAGSFTLDEEGFLCMGGYGRVLGADGNEIFLGTDKVRGDSQGYIRLESNEAIIARLGVYAFEDNAALERNELGLFEGEGAQLNENAVLHWGWLERSNANMVDQMTEMMTAQRALQSAAQIVSMYDEIMGKAAAQVGALQ